MARRAQYNSAEFITTGNVDAYLRPAFPAGLRVKRLVWNIAWMLLYRPSPRPFHGWRAMLLRAFGARIYAVNSSGRTSEPTDGAGLNGKRLSAPPSPSTT